MRKKRTLKTKDEIRELLITNMSFVQLNNRLFDDLYEQEEIQYHKIKDHQFSRETFETTFTELDMIVYIFLHFLQINAFTLYTNEIADYLHCSEKQLLSSIQKMRGIRVKVNSSLNRYQKRKLEDIDEQLLSEKPHQGYDNNKLTQLVQWFCNFEPDYKQASNEELTKVNFFNVTIYDLDLLTNGALTRKEFLLYLFLIRIYNSKESDSIWISNSTIARRLNIKGADTTLQKYLDKLKELELINIERPANYDKKIQKRQEPSQKYIPVFNLTKMQEMNLDNMEVDLNKVEMDSDNMETDFDNLEMNSNKWENVFE